MSVPPRALARSPRAVWAPMRRTAARGVAVLVLWLCVVGVAAGSADAGALLFDSGSLVFTNEFNSDPDRSIDLDITERGEDLVFLSVGDVLAFSQGAPCHDVHLYDTVACSRSAITSLAVTPGGGNDQVSLESGVDSLLCGGAGNDTLTGGDGKDTIGGAAGSDELSGGAGDDILRADRIDGAAVAACTETPGSPPGTNKLEAGPGEDLLVGDVGPDKLFGGAGGDYVFGRSGDDEIEGGDGDDLLVGLDGADKLGGSPGFDVLSGGSGADIMVGGDGSDHLGIPVLLTVDKGGAVEGSPEFGDDRMEGAAGDDTLFVGAGDRTVISGLETPARAGGRGEPNGADVLSGGAGTDEVSYVNREIPVAASLDGEANDGSVGEGDNIGDDVERMTGGTADDVIEGGPANDVLDGGPGSDRLGGRAGADVLRGGAEDGGVDALSGGGGPDALTGGPGADGLAGDDGDDELRGGGGDDRLDGGPGADDIDGEADADDLAGGPGADVLGGGPGVDRVDYADAPRAVTVTLDEARNDGERGEDWIRDTERIRGGARADSLVGDASVNAIEGGPGPDLIDAAGGADSVSAGPGRDAVLARDNARDTIACGAGRDVAVADELDLLSRGAELCERRDRGGGARRGEALLRPACAMAVRLPDAARVLPLGQRLSIPRGTRVATGTCAATLSAGRGRPRVRAQGGAFVLRRAGTRSRGLAFALAGPSFSTCRTAPASRRVRTLGVRARGRVRLVARHAATSGEDASWKVEDRCGSTMTKVRRGTVKVTDRSGRHAVVVRAPHTHVSRRGG